MPRRNRPIDEAVHQHFAAVEGERLRESLREGALARAKRDLRLSEEWFLLENEVSLESDPLICRGSSSDLTS